MPSSVLLLRDLSQANVAEVVKLAKISGSQVGVAQDAWARSSDGYEIHPAHFPDDLDGLARTVKQLQEAGLTVLLHAVEPYALPVPDLDLRRASVGTLSRGMNRVTRRIFTKVAPAGLREQPGKHVLQIDDELVAFENGVSHDPFGFTGCVRGVFGTSPREHAFGADVYCLLEPPRLRIHGDRARTAAAANRVAHVVKTCDFDYVYFERNREHEHVPSDSAADLEAALLRLVESRLCLSSVPAAESREGRVWQVLRLRGRGRKCEQFTSALSDEPKSSRRRCVEWDWGQELPSLIEVEQVCLRALVWDVPITIRTSAYVLAGSKLAARLLRLVGTYGEIRESGTISQRVKDTVRKSPFPHLAAMRQGRWRLLRAEGTAKVSDAAETRALLLSEGETMLVAYWHRRTDGKLFLPLTAKSLQVHGRKGRRVSAAARGNWTVVPIGDLRVLTVRGTSDEALVDALAKARVVTARTLWVQAEDYESLAGKMARGSAVGVRDEGALGDFIVATGASGADRNENWYCRYRIAFPRSGIWHLWGRVRYEDTNTNSFSFALGDGPNTAVKLGNDMVFKKWHWDQGPSLHYEKDANVFRVYEREGSVDVTKSPRLDVICFSDDPNYRPSDDDAKLGLELGM